MYPTISALSIEKKERDIRSIAPAIAIFAVFFSIGVYAGHLFAATAAGNSSVKVNAFVSANGANGSAGAAGLNGANGSAGASGTSTVSVKVKTVVNGKTVTDIDEKRESSDGSIAVTVSNGAATWSAGSEAAAADARGEGGEQESGSSGSRDLDSDSGSSNFIEVGSRSVATASATDPSDSGENVSSESDASETAARAPENIFVGFYSRVKAFFNHVASIFHIRS